MAQADFAYLPANDAGSALAVSIFADRDLLRVELSEDVADAGLVLREAGGLDALQSGEVRPLGEVVLVDCPVVGAAELAALVQEHCFYNLQAPIARVTGWDTPYPHAQEWDYFPGPARVGQALREVMEG